MLSDSDICERVGVKPASWGRVWIQTPAGRRPLISSLADSIESGLPLGSRIVREVPYYPDLSTYAGFAALLDAMNARGWLGEGTQSFPTNWAWRWVQHGRRVFSPWVWNTSLAGAARDAASELISKGLFHADPS